mgnify:CR=1 FL=1
MPRLYEITHLRQLWGESYERTLDAISTMHMEEDLSIAEIANEMDIAPDVVRAAIVTYRNRF